MSDPLGSVAFHPEVMNIESFTFVADRLIIRTRVGNLSLSPEATHIMLQTLNACNYPRAVCVNRDHWKRLINGVNQLLSNIYDSEDHLDPDTRETTDDIVDIESILAILEHGLL